MIVAGLLIQGDKKLQKRLTPDQMANHHEIMGNYIENLPLVKILHDDGYFEEVPRILFLLTAYF